MEYNEQLPTQCKTCANLKSTSIHMAGTVSGLSCKKVPVFLKNKTPNCLDYDCSLEERYRLVSISLQEARYFAKDVRQYLFEVGKLRQLTDVEKTLWDKTHDVHVHTNDAGLIIQELSEEACHE